MRAHGEKLFYIIILLYGYIFNLWQLLIVYYHIINIDRKNF